MLTELIQRVSRLSWRAPTSGEIQQETYWLGSRHHGEVLKGALLELKGAEVGSRRAALLRAVVLRQRGA